MARTMDAARFADNQQAPKNGGSRIKVAVRIRPLLDSEVNQGHRSTSLGVQEVEHKVQIHKGGDGQGDQAWNKTFNFD